MSFIHNFVNIQDIYLKLMRVNINENETILNQEKVIDQESCN